MIIGWQIGFADIAADIAALDTRIDSLEGLVLSGAADPTAGGGVAASVGSLYLRTNGTLYQKTGAGNTAWTLLASTAAPTFTGLVTADRFLTSLPGSAAAPAFTVTANAVGPVLVGVYSESSSPARLSLAVDGTRIARATNSAVEVLNASLTHDRQLVSSSVQNTVLSATTHDLSLGNVAALGLTTSGGPQILTSITGGVVGRWLLVVNNNAPGGDAVTLQDDNGADGTAANRIVASAGLNVAIQGGGSLWLSYRSDSRWHVVVP